MDAPSDNPFDRVVGPWERVLEDMTATAERYRDAGRTVLELHPGDVAVMTGEPQTLAEERGSHDPEPTRLGFDVVVPGDEFERLRSALADRTVDDYEVFRATGNGLVFLLIAVECGDDFVALIPAYYDRERRDALEAVAREHGLYTNVRPLGGDVVVTIAHDDPGPFFPD